MTYSRARASFTHRWENENCSTFLRIIAAVGWSRYVSFVRENVCVVTVFSTGVYCQSAVSVDLGRNVTVNCTTGYHVEWEIARDGAGPLYIYLNNNQEALERGFVLGEITPAGEADVHRLIALGSVENNGTTIYCRESAHDNKQLASYRLTVIGK